MFVFDFQFVVGLAIGLSGGVTAAVGLVIGWRVLRHSERAGVDETGAHYGVHGYVPTPVDAQLAVSFRPTHGYRFSTEEQEARDLVSPIRSIPRPSNTEPAKGPGAEPKEEYRELGEQPSDLRSPWSSGSSGPNIVAMPDWRRPLHRTVEQQFGDRILNDVYRRQEVRAWTGLLKVIEGGQRK